MKTCVSEEKLIKQFGTPLLPSSENPPPPALSINPLFLSNFFITTLFVQVLEMRNPLLLEGGL